ncbi:MAG: hypothetical protein K2M04_08035 [Muribaculaceae bacterium]|nr:hypothetical protein [Muribaculaceae bacterium]
MAKRKIGFYFILFKQSGLELPAWNPTLTVCRYLTTLERSIRKKDLDGNKFGFISEISSEEDDVASILFKSARHSYRAPLLDRNTVVERENPKTMDEGEQMKTHVVLKRIDGSPIALIESGNNLMTGNNIVDYLNFGLSIYNADTEDDSEKLHGFFSLEMMPRDDFTEVLNNMSRVTCANIYIDKNILGSSALNFTETYETIQDDVILQIKANRKKSILNSLYHIVDKYNGNQSNIRRIRVVGRIGNNNETIIDTGFIVKKEYVEVSQNDDTGEFSSAEMFQSIKELSNQFG